MKRWIVLGILALTLAGAGLAIRMLPWWALLLGLDPIRWTV
jgi:hypothetical protein